MNDECEKMRMRIEDSIGRTLGGEEQSEIDLHCSICESCEKYRERLMDDHARLDLFAGRLSPSELRAEERVIASLQAEIPEHGRWQGFRGTFARAPRVVQIAAAATAVIAVIAGIDLLRGVRNGPIPAFAAVIEKMGKVESVIYEDRRWSLGQWTTTQIGRDRSFHRSDYPDSTYISCFKGSTRGSLILYPATKRAVLWWGTSWPGIPETNPAQNLASMHKRLNFSFVRRARYEGRNAALYEGRERHYKTIRVKMSTWVDLDTELPFRIETYRDDSAAMYPYGLDVSDFLPPGLARSAAAGWTELRPGEPVRIWENFRWNVRDTSYFSMTPPPGYAVTKIDTFNDPYYWDEEKVAEAIAAEMPGNAQGIADAFSVWVSLSGGAFPGHIRDLGDSSKVRSFLISKHDKGGIPGDEFRAAIKEARQLEQGLECVQYYEREGALHYLGGGVVLGDSTRVVCWGKEPETILLKYVSYGRGSGSSDSTTVVRWKREPNDYLKHGRPYWIIYADLHGVTSLKSPKIPKK
jgi:hypothetical protein